MADLDLEKLSFASRPSHEEQQERVTHEKQGKLWLSLFC